METQIKNMQPYNGEDLKSLWDSGYEKYFYATSKTDPNDCGLVYTFYEEFKEFSFCYDDYLDVESDGTYPEKDYDFQEVIINMSLYE